MNGRFWRIADAAAGLANEAAEFLIAVICMPFLFGAAFVGCLWGAIRVGFSVGYAHIRGKLG